MRKRGDDILVLKKSGHILTFDFPEMYYGQKLGVPERSDFFFLFLVTFLSLFTLSNCLGLSPARYMLCPHITKIVGGSSV